ncbi:hypothetical protein ACPM5D_005554 [Escherichia coli]
MSDRARALTQTPPGQGFAPTPRQRFTAREKKFRVPFTVSGWGCVRHLVAENTK